jgi:NAD(P)-dependent dehydrogenase (short-subunit alcohol dehydrogenase family)
MNIPKKRLAVVTGGSAGIGEEICRQLLADGWAVVSMARRPPPFTHEHLHSVEVDLSDRAATAAAAEGPALRARHDHPQRRRDPAGALQDRSWRTSLRSTSICPPRSCWRRPACRR